MIEVQAKLDQKKGNVDKKVGLLGSWGTGADWRVV